MAAFASTGKESVTLQDAIDTATQKFHAAVEVLQLEYQRLVQTHAAAQDVMTNLKASKPAFSNVQTEADFGAMQYSERDSRVQLPVPEQSITATSSQTFRHPIAKTPFSSESTSALAVPNKLAAQLARKISQTKKASNPARLARDFALAQGWLKTTPAKKKKSLLTRTVESKPFDSFCASVIILNCILLFSSTDYAARNRIAVNEEIPFYYTVGDYVCNAWFVVELALRITSEGPLVFFTCFARNFLWNIFDTFVVISSLVETVVQLVSDNGGTNLTSLRMLRVLRLARALRIIRMIRLFKDLRMMVLSILNSFLTLMWALTLLLMLIFLFGIFLTQNVTSYLYADAANSSGSSQGNTAVRHASILRYFFGSMSRASYTLFKALTGGISWQEVSDPLFDISWINGLLFCFYIFFTVFSMLNIITGIFVESAITSTRSDHDEVITAHLHAEDSALRCMQKIFEEADHDNSGSITTKELDDHLNDPRMRAHLEAIGVEAGEAEGLFNLLDLDNSGAITVDEFLYGCMRMKGAAKAVDIQTLLYQNKKSFEKWNAFTKYVQTEFEKLKQRQEQCLSVIRRWDNRVDGWRNAIRDAGLRSI